jgi:hypothetical protein
MKLHALDLVLGCHNPYVLGRNKTRDPLDGLPEQGIFSHNLEHLLRVGFSA